MTPGDRVRISDSPTMWGQDGVVVGPGMGPGYWLILIDGDSRAIQFNEAALERHPPDGAP